MPEKPGTATVFGGTGFLGRRIVASLKARGWHVRIAVRRPERHKGETECSAIRADIHDGPSVCAAIDGASVVVNAVSLYVEKRGQGPTFKSVHIDGAERVARVASQCNVKRLIHISGIGADAEASSAFIRTRGIGEKKVIASFPDATIFRPSVMFGADDTFINRLAEIMAWSPVFPVIGSGTRLQPVFVDDVADAAGRISEGNAGSGETFELGGPDVSTMREIVEWLRDLLELRRLIVPVPMALARVQARLMEFLPSPPITTAQVELLAKDNVANPKMPGFETLGLTPRGMAEEVPAYLGKR